LPAPGEQRGICWIEFSPDGGTVAVANLSGGVHLYDARSRALLAELRGHVMGVLRASFFPDGKTLATGSLDGRVKLWNLATCQELLTLTVPLGGTFHSLAIAPNGCTLAVGYLGSPGHHVRLYRAPSLDERAEREPDAVRWSRP
jgi:WD40 repeat protein